MPTYSYNCQQCGPFAAVRPMAEFDLPAACPECAGLSARTLTMPALLGRRAQNQPRAEGGAGEVALGYSRLGHANGCACC
ncbi:MAG: FmdB family zinc ribbon protein [Pseudomonadota bacterium]